MVHEYVKLHSTHRPGNADRPGPDVVLEVVHGSETTLHGAV